MRREKISEIMENIHTKYVEEPMYLQVRKKHFLNEVCTSGA